jgi:mannonate dehydratase
MDRRGFMQRGGAAAAAAVGAAGGLVTASTGVNAAARANITAAVSSVLDQAAAGYAPGPIQRPLKLHVGSQRGASTATAAAYLVRHGVTRWVPSPATSGGRGYWVPSDLYQVQDFAAANGLTVEMVALPFLGSTNVNTEARPAIMLGQSPQRDQDIEDIQRCIAAMASAGIPAFKYNMSILGVSRSASTPGRGNSTYSTFNASALSNNTPTIAGIVTPDQFWDRINYFLQRVIPVCDQYKIMAACHPQDPGTPPGGYQGVLENVLSTPGGMGLFKFLSLYDSPYHGLNLCCGVLAEMLWNPSAEIYDIVRALARTKRLFNIHLRNIRGRRDNFQEVWADEGDINEARIVQILAEEGYAYSIDPDHEPQSSDDSGQMQGFAHGFGYIEGMIKAVDTFSAPYDISVPAQMQLVPNVLDKRTRGGYITAVITAASGVNLGGYGITSVTVNGVKAVNFQVSGDGRSVVGTFARTDIASIAVGNPALVVGTVAGAQGTFTATASLTVVK